MKSGLSGVRKADKAHGDDTTLTRFVKITTAEKPRKHRRQPRFPGVGTAIFIDESRTKFSRAVKPVGGMKRLLVSGHSNVKIGHDVRKAKFRGYWIFTLSLEERATCPNSCKHWQTCYGNNMPFAKRIDHTDPLFLPTLEREIDGWCNPPVRTGRGSKTPLKRPGILIRLHALGDFYSTAYVDFWHKMLAKYPNLAIYGYTARLPGTIIGDKVNAMNRDFGDRCMVRFSDGGLPRMSTVSIGDETGCPPNAFICPEQTGRTRCCATCGACWATDKNVAFMEH